MEINSSIVKPSPTFCREVPTNLKESSLHLQNSKVNQVGTVILYGVPIVSLLIDSQERLCLAQISNTLLKNFSYNEIHNRRVALGITCVQCTPVQLEILRRAGAMPVSSRRCGMITRREAERLCKSFLGDNAPPRLPEDFAFSVHHECAWGCRGVFLPSRYNSSRAKCIKCTTCGLFFSPNKFIFHSHRVGPNPKYVQPDAANFNSWRRHMKLSGNPPDEIVYAWEDVKAMFNGGTRKRLIAPSSSSSPSVPSKIPARATPESASPTFQLAGPAPAPPPRVPMLPMVMDYVWHNGNLKNPFVPYPPINWLSPATHFQLGLPPASATGHPFLLNSNESESAFQRVHSQTGRCALSSSSHGSDDDMDDETTVDIETCPEDELKPSWNQNNQRKSNLTKTKEEIEEKSDPDVNRTSNSDSDTEENAGGPFSIGGIRNLSETKNNLFRNEGAENRNSLDRLKKPYLSGCLSLFTREESSKAISEDPISSIVYHQPLATKPVRSFVDCIVCNAESPTPSA